MYVKGLTWPGVRTTQFEEMVTFFRAPSVFPDQSGCSRFNSLTSFKKEEQCT